MLRYLICLVSLIVCNIYAGNCQASSTVFSYKKSYAPKTVNVRGHIKKNGTYVPAHRRSRPRR